MAVRYLLPQLAWDFDVLAYRGAVRSNGGDVSDTYMGELNTFVAAEKASGAWGLTDDYLFFWGDTEAQALMSFKQRRLATAVAAPTFTSSRDYAFNGTTQYIDTGYIPATDGINCTATDLRIGVYERTNVNSGGLSAGTFDAVVRALSVNNRNGAATATGRGNTASQTFSLGVADSRGLKAVSRAGGGLTVRMFDRGVALVDVTAASSGAVRPTRAIYVGCLNNAGTAGSFRPSSVGAFVVGGPLSDAQELAQYNAMQALATARGANV